MTKKSALAVSLLAGALTAGCGGADSPDVAAAPETRVSETPAQTASTAPTATAAASATAVDLGPFTNSTTESKRLFQRMRAAGELQAVFTARGGGYGAKYRDVVDLQFEPIKWRERTYDPQVTSETIRDGDDLFERRIPEGCTTKRTGLSRWFVTKGEAGKEYLQTSLPRLAVGAMPFWATDLATVTFTSRTATGEGWTMKGTTVIGLGPERGPVRLVLDATGLPVVLTVGDRTSEFVYELAFDFDDVESIPTVAGAKVSTAGQPDFCDEDEPSEELTETPPAPLAPAPGGLAPATP